MAGTLEKRFFAASERVQRGDIVFLVADTTTLWLGAEIREQDWLSVQVTAEQELTVRFPGKPDQAVKARVLFAAREATPEINAIRIVAELDNSAGQYRPGMFARTNIPAGPAVECLVVPASCVVQHEGQPFVFVQTSPGKYRRQDVVCGREQGEWLEIVEGLKGGEQVVTEGAFLLKSTLLLENEAE
jgi:RND family efflux transporter MFP subunit